MYSVEALIMSIVVSVNRLSLARSLIVLVIMVFFKDRTLNLILYNVEVF